MVFRYHTLKSLRNLASSPAAAGPVEVQGKVQGRFGPRWKSLNILSFWCHDSSSSSGDHLERARAPAPDGARARIRSRTPLSRPPENIPGQKCPFYGACYAVVTFLVAIFGCNNRIIFPIIDFDQKLGILAVIPGKNRVFGSNLTDHLNHLKLLKFMGRSGVVLGCAMIWFAG